MNTVPAGAQGWLVDYHRDIPCSLERAADVLGAIDALARRCYVSPYDRAVLHTGLRETHEALRCLRQALTNRSPRMIWLNVEPAFDILRGSTISEHRPPVGPTLAPRVLVVPLAGLLDLDAAHILPIYRKQWNLSPTLKIALEVSKALSRG